MYHTGKFREATCEVSKSKAYVKRSRRLFILLKVQQKALLMGICVLVSLFVSSCMKRGGAGALITNSNLRN